MSLPPILHWTQLVYTFLGGKPPCSKKPKPAIRGAAGSMTPGPGMHSTAALRCAPKHDQFYDVKCLSKHTYHMLQPLASAPNARSLDLALLAVQLTSRLRSAYVEFLSSRVFFTRIGMLEPYT